MLSQETANDTANVGEETQPSPSKSGRLSAVLHHSVSTKHSPGRTSVLEHPEILEEVWLTYT
jgi:hypothetical protein